jgi:hypothetical protein
MDLETPHTEDIDSQTRKQDGTFSPGVSGNPKGRPVGARNRIAKRTAEQLDQHIGICSPTALRSACRTRAADLIAVNC